MAPKKTYRRTVSFLVDDRRVSIPVPDDVKAYFNEQFVRTNPSTNFQKRYRTLQNLMRLAYQKGLKDGG